MATEDVGAWERATPDQAAWQMLPARSTHDRNYVLRAADVREVVWTYELVNERTGQRQEIGGQGGLYMVMDIAEAIVCDMTGREPYDRNMLNGDPGGMKA